jgi:molybdate transport system substrate-binding protein
MEAPENTHKPVVYPIAMVNSSKNPDVAKDFIAYLSQDAQKNILAKYGFNVK